MPYVDELIAFCIVEGAGGFAPGAARKGVSQAARTALGTYEITFDPATSILESCVETHNLEGVARTFAVDGSAGNAMRRILEFNAAGAAADGSFTFMLRRVF